MISLHSPTWKTSPFARGINSHAPCISRGACESIPLVDRDLLQLYLKFRAILAPAVPHNATLFGVLRMTMERLRRQNDIQNEHIVREQALVSMIERWHLNDAWLQHLGWVQLIEKTQLMGSRAYFYMRCLGCGTTFVVSIFWYLSRNQVNHALPLDYHGGSTFRKNMTLLLILQGWINPLKKRAKLYNENLRP